MTDELSSSIMILAMAFQRQSESNLLVSEKLMKLEQDQIRFLTLQTVNSKFNLIDLIDELNVVVAAVTVPVIFSKLTRVPCLWLCAKKKGEDSRCNALQPPRKATTIRLFGGRETREQPQSIPPNDEYGSK